MVADRVWQTLRVCLSMGLWLASVARAEDPQSGRVAILDVSEKGQVPPSLVAQLELRLLTQEEPVVLLERSAVDRLLNEQALVHSQAGGFGGESAIQAGKIWGVDVFCLLEMSDRNFRVRMVDTWYGLKILDVTLPMPRTNEMEKLATQLALRVRQQLSALDRDPKGMRLVGVLNFHSTEPTNIIDDLSDGIQAAVEQQMMFQPGVIVVERRQVQPLLDERDLVPEMTEGLRASMLLLDGEFHLKETDEDQLVVYVQARRNEERVFTVEVTGPKVDLQELGARLALAIRGKMNEMASGKSMSPEAEAEMLLKQAKASADPVMALSAVAAAKALMPESDAYRETYLAEQYKWSRQVPLSLAQFRRYVYESQRMVDDWLSKPDFSVKDEMKWPSSQVSRCANMWETYEEVPKELRAEISGLLFEMFDRCWERGVQSGDISGYDLQRQLVYDLKTFNRIGVTDADRVFLFYAELSTYAKERVMLSLTNQLVWPEKFSKERRFAEDEQFYTWLRDREDPFLRMCGKRGLARIYACAGEEETYEKAQSLYEDFEEEFLFEYLPNVSAETASSISYIGGLPWWIFPFLDSRGFYQQPKVIYFSDEEKNLQYRADHAMRVMQQVFTDPRCPQRVNWIWSGELPGVLGQAGRFEEQAEALRLSIAYNQHGLKVYQGQNQDHLRWTRVHISDSERRLNGLLEKYPELRNENAPPPDPKYKAEPLVSFEKVKAQFGTSLSPYYLILEHGMAAVLASQGVLFLDPDTLTPLRFEPAPDRMSVSRSYAVDDSGIYTASRKGILFFPRKGHARMYFPNDIDLSLKINRMDVMKGRVYVLTGGGGKHKGENLLEYNISTGTRSVLVTSKAKVKEQVMAHVSAIYYVLAEAKRNRIHISLERRNGDDYGVEAYTYDPDTKTYAPTGELKTVPFIQAEIRRRGDRFINTFTFGMSEVDLNKGYRRLATFKSTEHRFDSYGPITRVGPGFVGINPWRGELNYFRGQGEPMLKIKPLVFPPADGRAPVLRDLATHDKLGLLILSSDGLYAVPGLQHTKGAE